MVQGPSGFQRATEGAVPDTLRAVYDRYREVETRELLGLLPPGGARSLYRHALERAGAEGRSIERDPLAAVRETAASLLPLPPYAEWLAHYLENRTAYLERLGVPSAPERSDPVTVELRTFAEGWYAALAVFRVVEGWRGFIEFHRDRGERAWRTADIFRESDPTEIRARFGSLTEASLSAFLRSALP